MDTLRLEDHLSSFLDDKTVVLAVGSYLGGQAILRNRHKVCERQVIKLDGSTVGKLDKIGGKQLQIMLIPVLLLN